MIPDSNPILIGIDVGGTFTDFVLLKNGQIQVYKSPTTPDDQSRAMVTGLGEMGALDGSRLEIVHGTTVATNALLERRGARTALITTAGFGDVIEIGRQNRPHLYALQQQRPPQPVPRALRFEVTERLDRHGQILTPLDEAALEETLAQLLAAQPESVAVCLLFSYQNPAHEERIAQRLAQLRPDLLVSLSSDVLPEYREYERTATVVVNAYVRPLVDRYMQRLSAALPGSAIRIMQSNGGAIGVTQAAAQPARLVLSGPAGGVVGAFALAQQALDRPDPDILTFDMGGTSTDVSICPGQILRTAESEIDGLPLRLPVIDIHTVGAGGGSLAYVDPGGGLRVGPQSAGAVPGPVCYGRGGVQPTVTDANLVLGRMDGGQFLGGKGAVQLDVDAARSALARLGAALGGFTPEQAALGVIRVANATMERALRRVSVERGHDPKGFALIPFGGAGPLHACELAQALGIQAILIPPTPGVLSALGLLMADVVHESAQSILRTAGELAADLAPLITAYGRMAEESRQVLAGEGVMDPHIVASMDARYQGQSYELTVPLAAPISAGGLAQAVAGFHASHEQRYGYALPDSTVEVVTLRVQAIGPGARPEMPAQPLVGPDPSPAYLGEQPVWFSGEGATATARYDRAKLQPGNRFPGPAMVYQFDTTTVVPPGWSGEVDAWGNLWLRSQPAQNGATTPAG
jgi:N-methylhydantoinase A